MRRHGDYRAARAAAQHAFNLDGSDLVVCVELGRLLEEFGDYAAAEMALRRGLSVAQEPTPDIW
jgi:hypothetical protein